MGGGVFGSLCSGFFLKWCVPLVGGVKFDQRCFYLIFENGPNAVFCFRA